MFLMIGVNDGQNALYYEKLVYFTHLGKAVNVTVFVTFTQLLLFFIPTFKWNKRYYVQLPNGEVFELLRKRRFRRQHQRLFLWRFAEQRFRCPLLPALRLPHRRRLRLLPEMRETPQISLQYN